MSSPSGAWTPGLLLVLLVAGCGRLPDEAFRPARAAIHAAADSRAGEYAPAGMDSARVWLDRATAMNASVPRTWYGKPRSELIAAALDSARAWANAAAASAESLDAERLARARERLAGVEARLRSLEPRVGRASGKRVNRSLVTRSELGAAEVRRWILKGEAARAESALAVLESRSDRLGERLDADRERFSSADDLARWRKWIGRSVDLSRSGNGVLVVEKESRRSYLVRSGRVVRTFPVDLGVEGTRPKVRQGDLATPEGLYTITRKKSGGETRYHKALLLDYPNAEDVARFRAMKRSGDLAGGARLGGLIEIHGEGGRGADWTLGCVALDNRDMDLLYRELAVGDKVAIVGRVPDGALGGSSR